MTPAAEARTLEDVMAELESLGTEQNRKVYRRHGVRGEQFGVAFGALRPLARRIGHDQRLAESLWGTGNHDARVLATMVADPGSVPASTLERWAEETDNYVLADALSALVAASPHAREKMDAWTAARGEWVGQVGWNVAATLAMRDGALPDDRLEGLLATIEREIHKRENRVRYAMNNALIAIGGRLERRALAVAEAIGKVEVDHGETGCATPDAAAYIRKVAERRRVRAAQGGSKRSKSSKGGAKAKRPAGRKGR